MNARRALLRILLDAIGTTAALLLLWWLAS